MASELEVGKLKVGDTHGEVTLNNTSGTSGSTLLSQTYNGGVAELRIGSNISTTSTSAMNVITGDAGDVEFNGDVKVGSAHANEDQTSSLIISKSIDSSGTHDYITLADTSNNGTEKLRLLFKGRYATGSHANGQEAAYISCNRDAGSDGYGLSFGTGDAADAVDRLTISRIGHVSIGDDKYYQWGGTNARIVGSHSGDYVKILTGNSAKLTINSDGHIILPTAGQTIKSDFSSGGTTRTSTIEMFNNSTGALSLKTVNSATGGIEFHTEGTKRLDVTRGGAVVVGDTPHASSGAISDLHVNKSGGGTLVLSRTTGDGSGMLGTVRFGSTSTDSTLAKIIATEAGSTTSSKLEFQTQTTGQAAATRLTIDNTGLATFANGIALQTSPSNDSATSNEAYTLDKYETGTFQLADGSGASLTITGGLGRYTRIGDRVFISVQFGMPSVTNGNHMTLEGLPFNTANNDASRGLAIAYAGTSNIGYSLTVANTNKVSFYTPAGVNASNTNGSGAAFWLNGHYRTA
jgi:hypothetical protein